MKKVIYTLLIFTFISAVFGITYASGIYGSKFCKHSEKFSCYTVKRGDTWENLFKDSETEAFVKDLNRLGNRLRTGMVIAVPRNLNENNIMDISPFDLQISPPGEKIIYVSLTTLAWGAYDAQGTLLRWGPISSAKGYCPDLHSRCNTPVGKFAIYYKQGAGCKSTKFPIGRGGAPMPYCMFFKGGFAMHGSYDIPGYNASHGCIRMIVDDAKWLNEEFVGYEKIPVIIKRDSDN
ncbi:MAG: L,D-transpeptidase [Gammaproteobacteria bacterium]|nr:L,D-transpeptidase [Gammaproteobacteria bacterium]